MEKKLGAGTLTLMFSLYNPSSRNELYITMFSVGFCNFPSGSDEKIAITQA